MLSHKSVQETTKKSSKSCKYKELMQKRISMRNIMRIPKDEGNFDHKENKPNISIKKKTFPKLKKKVSDYTENPYFIADHMRTFPQPKRPIIKKDNKPEPLIMSEVHTVRDIDEAFYEVIKGRPIKAPEDLKTYISHLRAITLIRTDTGFLTEGIAAIDHAFAIEMEEYDKINKLYEDTKQNYITCINDTYIKSKMIQLPAKKLENDVANMIEQLAAYSFEYVKTRNTLQTLVVKYETRAVYARFLNSFSPEWWRREFESAYRLGKGADYRIGEYVNVEAVKSETDILQEYKVSVNMPRNIHLYFKQPVDLMDIFEYIEHQCKIYIHLDSVAKTLSKSIFNRRDNLKNDFKLYTEEIQDYLGQFKKKVDYWEKIAEAYKAAFKKNIETAFKDLFASEINVKLFNCLQFVHTKMFGYPEDSRDSFEILMHDIESMYLKLTFALDGMDQKIVNSATKECFADDIEMMTRAHRASRELKQADIFRKSLIKSFEPFRSKD